MITGRKIRVLVVDDSAIVRKLLSEAIASENDLEVVGTAPDPFVAREKILTLKPDVLTLDIEMPRMDGLSFLKRLMKYHPLPVIVISSLGQASCKATLDALHSGAVEVLAKPAGPYSVGELRMTLASKIRAAAMARLQERVTETDTGCKETVVAEQTYRSDMVIAIGASTGGTEALAHLFKQMPASSPPVVITQHIPPVFSSAFAGRLNQISAMTVKEAATGDRLQQGLALLAPGNMHMVVQRDPKGYRVEVKDGPLVCYQKPSVDVMFASVAQAVGSRAIGVLLTGMGSDGANGLLAMKRAGAATMAQDEKSCVVFGMPKEAIRIGAVDQVVSLSKIAGTILKAASRPH